MGFFDSFNLVDLVNKDKGTEAGVNNLNDLGTTQAGIGADQLAQARARSAQYDPNFNNSLGLQTGIANDSRARAATLNARGDAQWNRYNTTFAPVEDKMANDAMNYDSSANLDRAAQTAGADVTKSYGAARDQNARSLSRVGVNPNSGRAIRAGGDMAGLEAAASAGAQTGARERTRATAIGLRSDAANYGRNLPMPSGTADTQLGLSAAQGLVPSTTSAINAPLTAANTAQPWYGGATTDFSGSGNLANAESGQRLGVGKDLLGEGLGAAGMFLMGSSKKIKEDKAPIEGDFVLEGLEKLPVESWKYKDGAEDGGRHVGPYAEDVNRQFGERAAPGGKALDLVTMNGLALCGIQELAKKVRKLEERGGLDMAKASRNTEPRRSA